jgi:hypothetical protein
MALEWKVSDNVNAYRQISKEEYTIYFKRNNIFELPTYYNDGEYFMMSIECYTLIWICGITIGIPNITEDNCEKVFNRISIHEKLFGSFMHQVNPKTEMKVEYPFTIDMIKQHIGITTNGIWMDTQEWKEKVMQQIVDDSKSY